MNPFPPVGDTHPDYAWEVIERDDAPSVQCKYDLDEDQEDREAALQQCARDAWGWLNDMPAGEYRVQFGVLYELPDVQFVGIDVPQSVQRQRNFQWNESVNRRVPLPPAAVNAIAADLLNELENKYGTDEWNPVTVYMRVRRGTGGVVLRDLGTASEERRLQALHARHGDFAMALGVGAERARGAVVVRTQHVLVRERALPEHGRRVVALTPLRAPMSTWMRGNRETWLDDSGCTPTEARRAPATSS